MKPEVIVENLTECTLALLNTLSQFNEDEFNTIPFESSWTAGQVAEHLLKSEQDLPAMLLGDVTDTSRLADEKVPVIESIFLNFDTKLKSPDYILPSSGSHNKAVMTQQLQDVRQRITEAAGSLDLSKTCTTASFPGLGMLTRWEWLNFVVCHSMRHTNQLKNIYQKLQEKS